MANRASALTRVVSVRRRRRAAFVMAGNMVLAVVALTVAALPSVAGPDRAEAVSAVAASSPAGSPSPQPTPAGEALLRMAEQATALPDDDASGYAFHHLRQWVLDAGGMTVPSVTRADTPVMYAVEMRRWQAADGSGLDIDVISDPDDTLAPADPGYLSPNDEFIGGRIARTDHFRAVPERCYIRGPLPDDAAALADQLAATGAFDNSPETMLMAAEEIYTCYYVELPVRRAVLGMLATMDGLTFQAQVRDRVGRTGHAVSLTSAGVRYTLVFDPASGRLLASEQRFVGAPDRLPLPPDLVRYYTLFVTQARRPGLA